MTLTLKTSHLPKRYTMALLIAPYNPAMRLGMG